MLNVTIHHTNGDVEPYWLGEEAPITLKAQPEGVSLVFTHEMSGETIEIGMHPSFVPMLQSWINAQPKNTFMAKEGKAEMIAEMDAFNKEWEERQQRAKKTGAPEPPF